MELYEVVLTNYYTDWDYYKQSFDQITVCTKTLEEAKEMKNILSEYVRKYEDDKLYELDEYHDEEKSHYHIKIRTFKPKTPESFRQFLEEFYEEYKDYEDDERED